MSRFFRRPIALLWLLGIAQLALWLGVVSLSRGFAYETLFAERPMLGAIALLFALSFLYLLSIQVVWKVGADGGDARSIIWSVWVLAVLMRLAMLWSLPIQEIDYYRYLWDGRALGEGVSPYAYSPAAIDVARADPATADPQMQRLIAAIDRSPQTRTIFERIDHRGVTSIYPPMSQALFRLATFVTPENAGVFTAINVFRSIIIGFDLLVILCLMGLLKVTKMPPARAVAYAFCPLVVKEFANSGHMDVIAIAFLTGALWLASRAISLAASSPMRDRPSRAEIGVAILWACAILVKFFPIILAPLLWSRIRQRLAFKGQVILAVIASLVVALGYHLIPARPPVSHSTFAGLGTFASHWEINDLAFSVVHENVRPPSADRPAAWYTVVPAEWRGAMSVVFGSMHPTRGPFLIAQSISALGILAVALGLAFRPWSEENGVQDLMVRVFWTLATLWYLSATQNPWYWAWVLPFALFVQRGWLLVSVFALIYYLRFWFIGNFPQPEIFGSYTGRRFFDEVIVWVQHAPFLCLLVLGIIRVLRRRVVY